MGKNFTKHFGDNLEKSMRMEKNTECKFEVQKITRELSVDQKSN